MRLFCLLALFCVLGIHTVSGQNDTLTGILRDAKMKAIKRYPVILGRENPITVKTTRKGVFTIPGANLNDTLYLFVPKTENVFKIPVLGYNYLHIQLKRGSFEIERSLEPDEALRKILDREYNKTSSSTTLTRQDIEASRCQDITCLLQRLSGLQVTSDGIRIRGINSIYGSNDPLIIVNGSQMDMSALYTISVYDIQEIKVLKEATIYGARGANGAILIETIQ